MSISTALIVHGTWRDQLLRLGFTVKSLLPFLSCDAPLKEQIERVLVQQAKPEVSSTK